MQLLLQETPIRKSLYYGHYSTRQFFFWIDPILTIIPLRIRLFTVRQDEVMVRSLTGVYTTTTPQTPHAENNKIDHDGTETQRDDATKTRHMTVGEPLFFANKVIVACTNSRLG